MTDYTELEKLAKSVYEKLTYDKWHVGENVFGNYYVYADNYKGMGRQHIATIPANQSYFGDLQKFIAAADPQTIIGLVEELNELEKAVYELQMNDPHLDFISQIRNAGLHAEWNELLDKLKE